MLSLNAVKEFDIVEVELRKFLWKEKASKVGSSKFLFYYILNGLHSTGSYEAVRDDVDADNFNRCICFAQL